MTRPFWTRFATIVIWLLAGGSLVYWGLKFVRGPVAPANAPLASSSNASFAANPQALALALGGGQQPVNTAVTPALPAGIQATRFVLSGVVLQQGGGNRNSVALIAVDGKPPRPYRVGAPLTDGVVLHSVAAGRAMLASDASNEPSVTLELPRLTSAVAGTAVAIRPPMPAVVAPPVAAPNPASPMAIQGAGTDPRVARPGASRPREDRKIDQRQERKRQNSPDPAKDN
jgi:general secretion pathway protein C